MAIYFSTPAIVLGNKCYDNDDIVEVVKSNYQGTEEEWKRIKVGINYIFRLCGTKKRYLGRAEGRTTGSYAAEAVQKCLEAHQVSPDQIDLLIWGGLLREYLEPATSMEVAAHLGIKRLLAFDVTSACSGFLQSLQVASSMMQANPNIKTAVCCSADFVNDPYLPTNYLDFNIQSFKELSTKAAGLTISNAASAMLLTKEPLAKGGAAIKDIKSIAIPESYDCCKVPISGHFTSDSKKIFDLGLEHVPVAITKQLKELNWTVEDVAYFLSHQPSKTIIHQLCDQIGIDRVKAPVTHHLYGNTISNTVPLGMHHLCETAGLNNGDKILLSSAGAGFSMVSIAAEWAC